jgi:hypothetical protein
MFLLNLSAAQMADIRLKKAVKANEGKTIGATTEVSFKDAEGKDQKTNGAAIQQDLLARLEPAIKQLDALRSGSSTDAPVDMNLATFIQHRFGYAPTVKKYKLRNGQEQEVLVPESFYRQLGINPNSHTIAKLNELGNQNPEFRFIIPEIFMDAMRMGMRRNPIHGDLIRGEQNVAGLNISMPHINMADMMPKKLGEAETIQTGNIDFGMKSVKLQKIGMGVSITDEARDNIPLNLLALQLEDFGVLMSQAIDGLAIEALFNGDQLDGSESAGTVGVGTANTLKYRDFLNIWIEMSRMGQLPGAILAGREVALDMLELAEFKGFEGGTTKQRMNVKTPLPQSQNIYIHGTIPDNQLMFVNPDAALVKLNRQALRTERDRNPKSQVTEVYMTLTTGFATMRRDARLILDKSQLFGTTGFPDFMDVDAIDRMTIK